MTRYVIRPATPADIPEIVAVARATWDATYAQSISAHNRKRFLDRAYALSAMSKAIRRKPGWFYVATRDEVVVGFAHYLLRSDGEGELLRIYIHPDHQRRGIGRAFLSVGGDALTKAEAFLCYVSVEIDNTGARAFYERFGFAPCREHARFLGDQLIRLMEYVACPGDLLVEAGPKHQISQLPLRLDL